MRDFIYLLGFLVGVLIGFVAMVEGAKMFGWPVFFLPAAIWIGGLLLRRVTK